MAFGIGVFNENASDAFGFSIRPNSFYVTFLVNLHVLLHTWHVSLHTWSFLFLLRAYAFALTFYACRMGSMICAHALLLSW
jgi:hypothetical protein